MSIAKVQHYVPQFLLRNFGAGKKDKIQVFDKRSGKSFATNARNVAAESRFYDFEISGKSYTIEPTLSNIEGMAKAALRAIVASDSIATLTAENRAHLAVFIAIQMMRTKAFREGFRTMPMLLKQWLESHGHAPDQVENGAQLTRVPDDNELAATNAHFILDNAKEFALHIAAKDWVLIATDARHPFLIGDNPITKQNSIDMGPRGNLGIAQEGIEIYLPISPTRAIAVWCPSHRAQMLQALERASSLPLVPSVLTPLRYARALLDAIEKGTPYQYAPENVLNFNSMQVSGAERYVFSVDGNFALVEHMLAEHPALRGGPRMQVA